MKYVMQSGRVAYIYRNGESVKEMHKEYPHCHWCGVETRVDRPGRLQYGGIRMKGNQQATRDHIFHKELHTDLRAADKKRNGGRSSCVLSCYECNSKRGEMHLRMHRSGRKVKQML